MHYRRNLNRVIDSQLQETKVRRQVVQLLRFLPEKAEISGAAYGHIIYMRHIGKTDIFEQLFHLLGLD